ncbi:hypothetical protein EP7_005537 (plasmid) [Isosphaeraceae bacterium EP7]
MDDVGRREFLAHASTCLMASAARPPPKPERLLVNTHVEVWTLDP